MAQNSFTRAGNGSARLRCADLWSGVATVALGVIGLAGSWAISAPSGLSGVVGPRVGPLAVSILLIVLGLLLAARSQLRGRINPADMGRFRTAAVIAAVMVGFVLLFEPLGFVLSAFLMMAILYRFLGERRMWLVVLIAASTSIAIYLGFSEGLAVGLPPSPFGF